MGPLIRIIADRLPYQVKAAILITLGTLLERGGLLIKAFLPQLQTIFVKSLNDPNDLVRTSAGSGLAKLMPLSTKVDLLITELLAAAHTAQASVQESILRALQKVLLTSGATVDAKTMRALSTGLFELLEHDEELTRNAAAVLFGVLAKFAAEDLLQSLMGTLLGDASKGLKQRIGFMAAVRFVVYFAYDRVKAKYSSQIVLLTQRGLADEVVISIAALAHHTFILLTLTFASLGSPADGCRGGCGSSHCT